MPEAAWCSACQKYVWVSPEGQCQFGHGAEFLSGRYVETSPVGLGGEDASSACAPPALASAPALTQAMTRHMWLRFAAFAIDYVLASIPVFVWMFALGFSYALLAQTTRVPRWLTAFAYASGIVILYSYFVISEALYSTTLGKRLLGLRVLSASTGGPITWKQSVTRNVWLLVDLLFWGLVGLASATNSPWRQRFGDKRAATLVVKGARNVNYLPLTDVLVRPAEGGAMFTRQGIILIAAVVVVFGGAIAAATWGAYAPSSAPAPASISDSPTQEEPSDAGTDLQPDSAGSEEQPPAPTAKTPVVKPLTATEWDAFIAEQYPGYRIKQRIRIPAPWNEELDDMHYVLVNKSRPKFTLLVNLAQLTPDRTIDQAPLTYYEVTDRIASDDALFSVDIARQTSHLRDQGQRAIIDGYLVNRPGATAVAYGGFSDEGTIDFEVATGKNAVARVIKNNEDADYIVEGNIPSGPHNASVRVMVSPL